MKNLSLALRLSLILVMTGLSTLSAQWNTLNHDATINRSVNDIFFVSSTGYACGSRADAVSWGSRGLLYKTTDGGQTWNTISLPLTVGTDSVMALKNVHFLSPTDGFAVATCYSTNGASGIYYGALLKTTDGGVTWTSQFSAKNQITYSNGHTTTFDHVFFSTPYDGVISGSKTLGPNTYDGVDYYTSNGGNNWYTATAWTGSGTQAHASFFFSNGTGSMVGGKPMGLMGPYNGRIALSTDNGASWTTTYIDNSYGYVDIHFPTAQIGYAIGDSMYYTLPGDANGKLVKTNNGGLSWTPQAYFTNFMPLCVFFTDAMTGYIGGETAAGDAGLKKTIDGGSTWTDEVYPDVATASYISSVAFSTPATGYATNAFTSSTSIYGNFLQSCAVFAGNDTTFCQTQGQIFATPATPGPNYVYAWSPSTGLSDSTAQAPFVNHVSNQQYVVTMTDTVTNCVATDTIVVSAYEMIAGPLYYCPVDSVLLDFGPGASAYFWQYFTDTNNVTSNINQNTQTYWATEPGYYLGFASFVGCGAITSYVHVIDSCSASFSCSVNAGPDTTFCQQQGQLFATPASPGNYTFSWSPANGLSNPNVQNPFVISGVNNQQYVVTMTDAAQNCTATDTVLVSAYYTHYDTVYNCNGQPVTLDFGPGASYYVWQFYTDPQGNTSTINQNSQTLVVTAPGQYSGGGVFPSCGALTDVFTVIDSCSIQVGNVWPGDCNYDLVANNADALNIGLAYNATGATRPNASPLWYAQPMTDWSQNFVNCNYKHADADGNGIVDVNDTLPIYMNYGNTHPFRLQPVVAPASSPALTLVANYDTVGLQTLVTVDIRLGSAAIPIDSLYGISFRITADAGLIDTTLTIIDLNQTWLGTMNNNMFGFRKYFRNVGSVDAAESRNNLNNRLGGNGTIGTFYIVTTDNLSGIAVCHINVTDITAVTVGQTYLTLNTVNDSVVIDPMRPAGIATAPPAPTFTAYPNPANSTVTVQTNGIATQVEICDMLGRTIMTVNPTSTSTAINTSELAEGVYLLRVKNGKEVSTQKLSITH